MKTLVLTAYDDAFAPLGELTAPLMEQYAKRHGYDFRLRRARPHYLTPLWWKLNLVADAIEEGRQAVLWMDADMVVTNPAFGIQYLSAGLHFSQDWGVDATDPGHFSCGAYVATQAARPVFDWCWERTEQFESSPFGDQDAMRAAFPHFPELFKIHPRRSFNAVHPEIHPSVVEPWQPGDFLCHLTMVPLERRIELFHQLCNS